MNNQRRKALKALLSQIDVSGLESIRDDEQEAYDNLPETLQESPKAEKMLETIDALNTLIDGLEEGIDTLIGAAGLNEGV